MNIIDKYKELQVKNIDLRYELTICERFNKYKGSHNFFKMISGLSVFSILVAIVTFYFMDFTVKDTSYLFVFLSLVVGFHSNTIMQFIGKENGDLLMCRRFKYSVLAIATFIFVIFGLIDISHFYLEATRVIIVMTVIGTGFLSVAFSMIFALEHKRLSSYSIETAKKVLQNKTVPEMEKELDSLRNEIKEVSQSILNSKENMLLLLNRDKTNEGTHFTECFDNLYNAFKEKTMKDNNLTEPELLLKMQFEDYTIKNT